MPTPKPDPKKPKKPAPYKYKTEKVVIPAQSMLIGGIFNQGKTITIKRAMSSAELTAEKKKAPKGTSVWRDPSVGFDGLKPKPKKGKK